MFGEGKRTELEEARLREAAVEKPMVTRDTISDAGPQASEGEHSLLISQSQAGKAEEAPNSAGDTSVGPHGCLLHIADPNQESEQP